MVYELKDITILNKKGVDYLKYIAILNKKSVDYWCIIWNMGKSNVINKLKRILN